MLSLVAICTLLSVATMQLGDAQGKTFLEQLAEARKAWPFKSRCEGKTPCECKRDSLPKPGGPLPPHCDADGSYSMIQCDRGHGPDGKWYCWCTMADGKAVKGTTKFFKDDHGGYYSSEQQRYMESESAKLDCTAYIVRHYLALPSSAIGI